MKGQPFFFDKNIFDEDTRSSPTEEEKEPVEFTQSDLESAKEKAFEEGKKVGFQEAENGKVQSMLTLMRNIEQQMKTISASENDRMKLYSEDAVLLSHTMLQKLFPALEKAYGAEEMKRTLEESIASHAVPNDLRIDLSRETAEELQDYIADLAESTQKTLSITPARELRLHEFRISWPEGGIIHNRENIAQKAFDLITEALAERGINVHHEDDISKSNSTPEPDQETSEPNSTGDL